MNASWKSIPLSIALSLAGWGAPAQSVSWMFSTVGISQANPSQGGFVFIASNDGWAAAWPAQGGLYSIPPRPPSAPGNSQPAPAPITCSYSLGATAANLPGGTVSDMIPIAAPAGCGWTAQSRATWLRTTSTGNGDGWVSYVADANRTGAWRTGTLLVAEQTFTVTQAPEGYVWHGVFEWLFAARDGWYHAAGLGWLWFHHGGEWIWSASLRDWLAVTDYRGRRVWTTQHGFAAVSPGLPGRLDSELLGTVFVGDYHGQANPEGWLYSETLGYLWPNGDGVWYYSERHGWLGLTGPRQFWSAERGAFL